MSSENLRDRLAGVHSLIAGRNTVSIDSSESSMYERLAAGLGGSLRDNYASRFCVKRTTLDWSYCHGLQRLDSDEALKLLPASAFLTQESPAEIETDRLLFIDTETTGLGGVGVVPFLVGCGSYTLTGFEVRQYIIPDYSDEAAMLEAVLEEFSPGTVVVSYNGKAFDLPILRDRMIVNRVARELPFDDHFDLLHAVRRLFRRRLGDCTLGNIERELFGFYRLDDIPGYLVPSAYFDWLASQELSMMTKVVIHNQLDVVSLAFLAQHIARAFVSRGRNLTAVEDQHSLARVYGRRRQTDEVNAIFERMDRAAVGRLSPDALFYHAQALKRAGQWPQATRLWRQLAASGEPEAYWASLELAKYWEHQAGDFTAAIACTRQAQVLCPYGTKHQQRLRHRLQRLLTKTSD